MKRLTFPIKKEDITNEITIPVEIQIIEAANKDKKLIERVIGFTEFEWPYSVVKFNGETSRPQPFSLFDEAICGILLIEEMPFEELGRVLGLNVENDLAEKQLLENAIESLKNDKMLEG